MLVSTQAHSESSSGFLRQGDLWVCSGDSITNADTYRRTIERVIGHYHPEAGIRVVNSGKSGALIEGSAAEFEKVAQTERPTVVSIMSAMNHSVFAPARTGPESEQYIKQYLDGLRRLVRSAKGKGMTVVVMSPTLTDERWRLKLAGTRDFLNRCTVGIQELTKEEGVLYLPVSEEMEAAQDKLSLAEVFRPDGIHPASRGEYQIASSFLRHIDFSGELAGDRAVSAEPLPSLQVDVTLSSRRLAPGERNLRLNITTPSPMTVTATWSCGTARGQEVLKLSGSDAWTIKLPKEITKLKNGEAENVVIDLRDGNASSVYLVDLCRTRVLHLKENEVCGVLKSTTDRPEGKTEANWQISREGNSLIFEAQVFDSQIRNDFASAWGRDGITLWLDYRGADRFGDINVDSDVHQTCIAASDNPKSAWELVPWLGLGMDKAARVTVENADRGYNVRMVIDGQFSEGCDSSLEGRDFVGINIGHVDLDKSPDGQQKHSFTWMQPTKYAPDQYSNSMAVIDLKNNIKGNSIMNAAITRLK